jgi:hypothetical protein
MRAMNLESAALPDDAPHLLVVDDDRRIRDLLSRFLFASPPRNPPPRPAPSSKGCASTC